ncbi:LmbU family transcriptional regulator [Amycolatopsis sp. NEAU-NG30]|uniref:LmbU family transcriptional regulator n=1 Tax=Amycolatopsis melonis TaxID=3156488 RepID=A0ABV0LBD8_9PSEU
MNAASIPTRSRTAAVRHTVVTPPSLSAATPGPAMGRGVQVHKSGLLFTAQQSLGMWEQVGSRLFSFADSSTWWIADWLVYGETTFQDRYEEAIKQTSLSYQTLRNYTWVARRFPLARRRQVLSFSHHLEVVALAQPEQDYWLRKAEELTWSRNRLRAEIRASQATRDAESPQLQTDTATEPAARPSRAVADPVAVDRQLHLAVSPEELKQLESAAGQQGMSVENWAAETLRRAAAHSSWRLHCR